MPSEPTVLMVFGLASVTAIATGLGALPFVFLRTISPTVLAHANALAAGLMLGATFGLVVEGSGFGLGATLVGANLGVLFVLVVARSLEGRDLGVPALRSASGARMVLIVLVMTVHSIAEGVAVGASFAGSLTLGSFITLAIAVHNVPEGLAISAVLRPRGMSVARCAGWSVFSSLPQPIMAVPAFLFVDAVRPALPYAMGFAAGAMMVMVLEELLPEAYEEGPRGSVALVVSASLLAMVLFQALV